jgi:exodeoxyribonuclease VII large subunit
MPDCNTSFNTPGGYMTAEFIDGEMELVQTLSSEVAQEFTVTEISRAIKQTVEGKFSYVRVRGEISGCKAATSGHMYFSLKDDHSLIASVCWKGVSTMLAFKPEDGMEVICTGRISTFPGRSTYQLVVHSMEVAGVGALLAMLEKRKNQLAKEGLFDASRKQKLPLLPMTIGVVTSPTGAVIQDILHRISDRFPVHVLIWGVLVQGTGAAEEIAEAIHGFNNLPEHITKPDLLIVARGGGSIEDLWAFNEEVVIRAVADSKIPLISAVGHETDTTLIDYVSDMRAPTPTAAAELALPVREEMLAELQASQARMVLALEKIIERREVVIERLSMRMARVSNIIADHARKVEKLSDGLKHQFQRFFYTKQMRVEHVGNRLTLNHLKKEFANQSREISNLENRMEAATRRFMILNYTKLDSYAKLLESYHYQKVLKRGYALVRAEQKLLISATGVSSGQTLSIEFHDGHLSAFATEDLKFTDKYSYLLEQYSQQRKPKKKSGIANENQDILPF